ncbi:MAG TPA: class I SAM-dependent rRNA methyltransferase [Patescibacteria group bacterium]|nr:class I SAM-dependent rRNA methyltransferase [Patescibacteria group bacterium]
MSTSAELPAEEEGAELPGLFLKRGEDARLRQGHLWVFSNEVDVKRSPLGEFEAGQQVAIVDAAERVLGLGYINPNALICARMVERGAHHPLDKSLIVHRLNVALALREQLYDTPHYRLVFGESDGLPGLVIDRFGDVFVGQIGTLGMEGMKAWVVDAVAKVFKPRAFLWKNSGSVRKLEALPEYDECAIGDWPEYLEVIEGGVSFKVDPRDSQKTGWFYDQRDNRDRLPKLVKGKRVLDVFSYGGGWGLRAAAAGASEVVCVDASATALSVVNRAAQDNGFADKVKTMQGDAFDVLKELRQQRERFDVVIVDPPAFIKRKKDFAEGRIAYRRINEMAMQLLTRDGLLIACSCSHHLPRPVLLDAINQGARHLDRSVQVLMSLQQSACHPVHPAIPETDYLKGYVCRVLPS